LGGEAPDGGAVTGLAQLSDTEGYINVCPMEGPRLHAMDGVVRAVWSDAGGNGEVWTSASTDGGESWSASKRVTDVQVTNEATMTSSASGIWVTFEKGSESYLTMSSDGGNTFGEPVELVTPDGPLGYAQAESGGGVTVVVGTISNGRVWLYRVE
jgi:hypothetical protein